MCYSVWVSRQQNTVYRGERKVRRTLTSTRFQLRMPTATTNTGLRCCFKLCVYLFYLLKKTWHTYTRYLHKYKAAESLFLFLGSAHRRVGSVSECSLVFSRGVKTRLVGVQSEVRASETLQCPLVLHRPCCQNHRTPSPLQHIPTVVCEIWNASSVRTRRTTEGTRKTQDARDNRTEIKPLGSGKKKAQIP